MESSVYRKLQKHMDSFPIGFPATETGIEIKILQYLFSQREAELLLHLSILPQSVNQIYRRVKNIGYTKKHLKYMLDKMVSRNLLSVIQKNRKTLYRADMLAVGLYEYKVDEMDKELSELILQYMEDGFRNEFFRSDTKLQLRTIPVEKSFTFTSPVGTYDDIRNLINDTIEIWVGDCVCRKSYDLIHQPCKRTQRREWCFSLGYDDRPPIIHGTKRPISKQEAMDMLEKAEEEGLVLQPSNSQKPAFLCVCCGCCCGVLSEAKHLDKPAEYFDTNYYSVTESELCIGCGKCINRCNMDAISIVEKKAVIDLTKCIGCGVCVTSCPKDAIHLVSKSKVEKPPKTTEQLYLKILKAKTPIRKILGMAIRTFLGLNLDPKYEKYKKNKTQM